MIRLVHILRHCRCYYRAMGFKDHFSSVAASYSSYRPRYPVILFEYLASLAPSRETAWDCATGSGQAALGLAEFFDCVIATDASAEQIANAHHHPRVTYKVATAEAPGLESDSVDLLTVAQAVHWFDWDTFYPEAKRIIRPGGICAVISYLLCHTEPAVDRAIDRLYTNITAEYWPPERHYVEKKYRTIPFPFRELAPPEFETSVNWTLPELLGYLGTWSAVDRYKADRESDPLDLIRDQLADAWGDAQQPRTITWPLVLRVGRNIANDQTESAAAE